MTLHPLPQPDPGPESSRAGSERSLTIRIAEYPEQTAEDFGRTFADLQALIESAALAVMRNRMISVPAGQQLDRARGAVYGVHVARIRYESPLEVVFFIGAAGGVGTALFDRIVDLYMKVQRARVETAEADVAVARSHYEVNQIHHAVEIIKQEVTGASELQQTIHGAARALTNMESAEIDPGTSAG